MIYTLQYYTQEKILIPLMIQNWGLGICLFSIVILLNISVEFIVLLLRHPLLFSQRVSQIKIMMNIKSLEFSRGVPEVQGIVVLGLLNRG